MCTMSIATCEVHTSCIHVCIFYIYIYVYLGVHVYMYTYTHMCILVIKCTKRKV